MHYHATLEKFYSRRDANGNCYWAFRFTDHVTGRAVVGNISGGESNLDQIRFGYSHPGEWDAGIRTDTRELPIRDFKAMVRHWAHAGCAREQLHTYIWTELHPPRK